MMKKPLSKKTKIIIGIVVVVLIGIITGVIFTKKPYKDTDAPDLSGAIPALPVEAADIFSIPEYDEIILAQYKLCIFNLFEQNGYLSGENKGKFFITPIKDRAKKVVAYGNFTDEKNLQDFDIAVLLEENDYKSSALFIMSSKCNLLFYKYYEDELPIINSFKKGQKIYIDDTKLVPSPSDGIILKFKNNKKALVFNPKTKTFEEYYQYSKEDLEDMKREEDYYNENEEAPISYIIFDPEGYVNLRKGNTSESEILQQIKNNEEVEVLNNEGNWWLIKTQEGNQGYVYYNRVKEK